MEIFFDGIVRNLGRIFAPRMLRWHILAIILTYLILASGFDWQWFMHFNSTRTQTFFFLAVALGGIVPIITPFALLAFATVRKSKTLKIAAGATGQAAALGWLVSALYKSVTGRIPPPLRLTGMLSDTSHGFQLGLWRGGIFWGWPSSHTTVAFAVSVALFVLYRKRNRFFALLAIAYAFFIGIGVSMSIHWFSEFAAGAIFGSVVGAVVGRSFAHLLTRQKSI